MAAGRSLCRLMPQEGAAWRGLHVLLAELPLKSYAEGAAAGRQLVRPAATSLSCACCQRSLSAVQLHSCTPLLISRSWHITAAVVHPTSVLLFSVCCLSCSAAALRMHACRLTLFCCSYSCQSTVVLLQAAEQTDGMQVEAMPQDAAELAAEAPMDVDSNR